MKPVGKTKGSPSLILKLKADRFVFKSSYHFSEYSDIR